MKKFIAIYMAPAATIAEMMKAPPEQMKMGMDAWMKWFDAHKGQMADSGAPLGKTKRITSGSVVDATNEMTGYSVVNGESAEAAAKIFKDHPHLALKGATIELVECIDMSTMM